MNMNMNTACTTGTQRGCTRVYCSTRTQVCCVQVTKTKSIYLYVCEHILESVKKNLRDHQFLHFSTFYTILPLNMPHQTHQTHQTKHWLLFQ